MLPKHFRLPATQRLSSFKTTYTPFFTVKIAKNNLQLSRFGFILSKKIDKRAVVRNRTKRRFRACVEAKQSSIQPGYDFLFLLKKEAIEQPTDVLCKEIYLVLKKQKLVDEKTIA